MRYRAGIISLSAVLAMAGWVNGQDAPVNAILRGHWDEYSGLYADIWAEGDYAYLPNWSLADGQTARVHIIDISDPSNPVLDNTLFIQSPNDFASPQDVKVADGLLFIALEGNSNDSAVIVDVRDPTAPVELVSIHISGFLALHNLFYDSGFLYLVNSSGPEMAVVDLTDFDPDNPPASPITKALWVVENIGTTFVHDVTVLNGRAYVSAWDSGLWIYDVSDIANTAPVFLGRGEGDSLHSAWPTDDGRFVVAGEERPGGPLKLFEVTEKEGFVTVDLRDELDLPEAAFSVHNQVVVGDRVYVSWYQAGLQVYEIDRDGATLEFVASFDTSEFGNTGGFEGNWGVYPFLGTDRILMSDLQNGLYVVAVVPEDCTPGADCNDNGVLDQCDLTVGTSQDCNQTFIPDECELADGSSVDCQDNGIPDECEADCNENGIADECDLNSGTSMDCQENGIPDECEADCNENGLPDDCDVTGGTSMDCQLNGIPDECDIANGPADDLLANQPPDGLNGIPSDEDEGKFGIISVAEDFVIDQPKTVHSFTIWGIYFLSNVPVEDKFTVIVHEDAGGLPGAVIASESQVETERNATGDVLFGFWTEYEYVLTLAEPVDLEPGTYWVEIYNNTDGSGDTFIWETGSDAQILGTVLAFEAPGETWLFDSGFNMALEVRAGLIGADENENGIPDECEGCEGDANADGVVDPLDTGFVLSRFGCAVGGGDLDCDAADQNDDGVVDPLDVGFVLSRFGDCL